MASFKHYFNSRFAGCRLLAEAFDQHRNRNVSIYQIPGHIDVVGVSDTIDRWIAPVAPELFSVNIYQLMRDLHDGKDIKLPIRSPLLAQSGKKGRRALIDEAHANPPPAEPEPVKRRPGKSQVAPARSRILVD